MIKHDLNPNIYADMKSDTISPDGKRLSILEINYHRFIMPEVNTYRMWSRSSASSRAIPLKKRIEEVRQNPAIPIEWGKNQAGMVAKETLDTSDSCEVAGIWIEAASAAADYCEGLKNLSLHKQVAARILEPFLWQTSVIASTDFSNMMIQRIHPDAQPEFQALAVCIRSELEQSTPRPLDYGQWTLPYILEEEFYMDIDLLKKISTARVARTSYANQGIVDIEKDLKLYNDVLISSEPPHYAPFEMIATPAQPNETVLGNFIGWHQFRHLIEKGK